nr:hypothetical protein [Tanacetum cinerariifolium]
MDTLSEVSEYLNNLEAYLDDEDSSETKMGRIEKSFEALEYKSVVVELEKHKVVVFTKAPLRAYSEPFLRFSKPCGVDGQEAWDAKLDFAYSNNYIINEMLGKLGFVRLDYGNYGRRMVKEVRIMIHGFNFLVDFVVIDYANEGVYDIDTMLASQLEDVVKVRSTSDELVKEEQKPTVEVMENYMVYRKKLDEVMMGRARLENKEFGDKEKSRLMEHGFPNKLCDLVLDIPIDKELPLLLGRPFLWTCGAIIDMGFGTMIIDDGFIRHTYFPKPRAKEYLENFEVDKYWLGCFEVGRDEDGNQKYGPMAPLFLDIKDEMERALAMEAYFNSFKNIIILKRLICFLGSLPVQLKNTDWGSEGHGVYKGPKKMEHVIQILK